MARTKNIVNLTAEEIKAKKKEFAAAIKEQNALIKSINRERSDVEKAHITTAFEHDKIVAAAVKARAKAMAEHDKIVAGLHKTREKDLAASQKVLGAHAVRLEKRKASAQQGLEKLQAKLDALTPAPTVE